MDNDRKYYQYEMLELRFSAPEPKGSCVSVDLNADFSLNGETVHVHGFYAGNECFAVRFLPRRSGDYRVSVSGIIDGELTVSVLPAREGHHGLVRAENTHFMYDDGTLGIFFGTTVYALLHQSEELIDRTMETLASAPFNKIRLCVFPKDYRFNHNEPDFFAFERRLDGRWNTDRPCYTFWDAAEKRLEQLFAMGIEVDLILFHPYDRWGLAQLEQSQNLCYLDYLLRRWSAYPGLWWSMANEYDLCASKSIEDWYEIERFIHEHDPYGHLLSNHSCVAMFDASRPLQTHISWQTKQLGRIPEMLRKLNKPVFVDECCYEGDLPEEWGSITGQEMTARFWRCYARGGACTHGETFDPGNEDGAIWWAKGGELHGESPSRIAFLRKILEELPGPLEPVDKSFAALKKTPDAAYLAMIASAPEPERRAFTAIHHAVCTWMSDEEIERFDACENTAFAHAGDEVWLRYYDWQASHTVFLDLPDNKTYRIEVIDTWNMSRETVSRGASGRVAVPMPRKPYMAVLAIAEKLGDSKC